MATSPRVGEAAKDIDGNVAHLLANRNVILAKSVIITDQNMPEGLTERRNSKDQ